MSPGNVWVICLSVTVTFVTGLVKPLTVIPEG